MKMLRSLLTVLLFLCTRTLFCFELPLTVIIPAYNNAAYVENTLNSIAMQNYRNYRIIYIDDCSTDGSPALVERFINNHQWHDKMTFIRNEKRYRKMRNVYYAINYLCDDDEIIVFVDCDDLLAHASVFSLINTIFSNPFTWFMYGNDKAYPDSEVAKWGISRDNLCFPTSKETIERNSFRSAEWVYMHIRAFRAWLYKSVKIEDLLADKVPGYQGLFYPACNDYANIYPMLEMAGNHLLFNPELVYLYNAGSPLNGFKIDRSIMIASGQEIKTKKPYQPLAEPIMHRLRNFTHATADLIIFSTSPDETNRLLNEIPLCIDHAASRTVIYQPTEYTIAAYTALAQKYPEYLWIAHNETELETLAGHVRSSYCLLLDDATHVERSLDLSQAIIELERMHAHCVNFGLTSEQQRTMKIQEITNHIKVYSHKHNPQIMANSTRACLYRSQNIVNALRAQPHASLYARIAAWKQSRSNKNVGIILA